MITQNLTGAQRRLLKKKYASLKSSHKNSHRNHTNRIFCKKIFRSIDLFVLRDACHELLYVFGDSVLCVRDAGRRGNKITAFSLFLFHSNFNMKLNEPYILYFCLFWSSISFVWTDGRLFTQRCRWNWPGLPATNLPTSFQHFSSIWPCGKSVQRPRLLQTHTARLNFVFGKKRWSSHATN